MNDINNNEMEKMQMNIINKNLKKRYYHKANDMRGYLSYLEREIAVVQSENRHLTCLF